MQQTISSTQPEVRSFRTTILPIINVLFYVVLAVSILAFIYYLYTHLDLINTYLVYLLEAAALTLGLSVVSMVLAVLFGFLGALGRRSRFAPIRYIALVYVEVVRGTPILVQLCSGTSALARRSRLLAS